MKAISLHNERIRKYGQNYFFQLLVSADGISTKFYNIP